jgi:hypothetical protein
MKKETIMMVDQKRIFLDKLAVALRADPRTSVDGIDYKVQEIQKMNYIDEKIGICFEDGTEIWINTTGNSNLANMVAIGKALL